MANETPTPVIDALRAQGEFNPAWEAIAELDAAWLESFLAVGLRPRTTGALDARTYELIAIAVDASCTHMYAPGVCRHIRKALEIGVKPEEIMAVLEAVAALGLHSCALGFPILAEEMASRAAEVRSAQG